ncbi:helix-turn-helix domain-containing protein [bacterium]|nr:helix-turn-helix domain-containing protein [bacterium]
MNRSLEPSISFGDATFIADILERTKDVKHARRLTAIRFRMLGYSSNEVCRLLRITHESLRKWVNAWNKSGEAGL